MQLQHISHSLSNVISITQIRQDIDVLLDLLKKYPEVHVLRGQDIIFDIKRPITEEEKNRQKKMAAESIRQMSKNYVVKPGEKSLTEILIKEREKMRSGTYEI